GEYTFITTGDSSSSGSPRSSVRGVHTSGGRPDFALRRGHRYATILIDAATGERIEVLPDRKMETVTAWLKAHPGIEAVCRDGAGGFAQATTDADPAITQVCDRWHLWHGLAEAAQKEIAAHSGCWFGKAPAPLPPSSGGSRSTNCSMPGSACWNAPAVWASH
ncbi:transposase, partial [Kitasatospora sp. NPDC001683]